MAAAATLLGPFGVRVWTYTVEIATNPTITRFASEWEPTTIRNVQRSRPVHVGGGRPVAAGPARSRVSGPSILRLIFFFALALPAIRGIVWWGLAAPVIVAGWLQPPRAARSERTDEGLPCSTSGS